MYVVTPKNASMIIKGINHCAGVMPRGKASKDFTGVNQIVKILSICSIKSPVIIIENLGCPDLLLGMKIIGLTSNLRKK